MSPRDIGLDPENGLRDPMISVTFGSGRTQSRWTDRQSILFSELAEKLSTAKVGAKDGPCYTPATFTGISRVQHETETISIAVLDSDCGYTLQEIVQMVEAHGWQAVIHSTFSHLATKTEVVADHADRWMQEHPGSTIGDYLETVRGYLGRVIKDAVIVGTFDKDGKPHYRIEHAPCPKFRIILPLLKPWVVSDYGSQDEAVAAWKERYAALAAALRLHADPSCKDPNRLFYLPRRRDNGTPFVHQEVTGEPVDLFGLDVAPETVIDITGRTSEVPAGRDGAAPEPLDFGDGTEFNWSQWAGEFASRFEITKAVKERSPDVFSKWRIKGVKHHIECPSKEDHITTPGGREDCYVVNASLVERAETPKRTSGFTIHCSHAGCKGRDRLYHLKNMVVKGWLSIADLTDERFLVPLPEPFDITALLANAKAKQQAEAEQADDEADDGDVSPVQALSKDERAILKNMLDSLNADHAVVSEEGKTLIFRTNFDDVLERNIMERLSFQDFRNLYNNVQVVVGYNSKKSPVLKTKANYWLENQRRMQFSKGVMFDPSGRKTPGKLNLWQGFQIDPVPGDWSLMRNHIREVLCDGNAEHFDWLMNWLARMFQRPGELAEIAVVLKSGEGSGKGTLGRWVGEIIGQHAMQIGNSKHLVGNFNQHLRDCVFLFADEACFTADKQAFGILSNLITEESITIESKFKNPVQQKNFLHILMASNAEWIVSAASDARRYFVLNVPDTRKGDHAYFAAINAQMEAGGAAAMHAELLARDIAGFIHRKAPETAGLQEQKALSLGTTDRWWKDCLGRGFVYRTKHGLNSDFDVWMDSVTTALLYDSYMEFAKTCGERHPLSREALGRYFVKMKARPKRLVNGITGESLLNRWQRSCAAKVTRRGII